MASTALIEYHLPAAQEFYNKLGYAEQGREAAKDLCGFILSRGLNEVAARDVSSGVWTLRNNIPGVRSSMELLEAYGWVRPAKFVKGAPTKWLVNTSVHKLYAKQAEVEKTRREKTRTKINEAVSVFGQRRG